MLSGQKLKEIRENKGLTISELSEMAKVPFGLIEDLESGRKKLTPQVFTKLVNALELEQEDFVFDSGELKSEGYNLGEKIRILREKKGYSLVELGELTDLSFTYLSEVERGTTVPALNTLRRIADALDVKVSILLPNKRKESLVVEKLQRIRKIKGLTQKQLALKAGISPGLVGQIEMGKVKASLKTIEKLANALGVSVCYLILDQEEVEEIIGGLSPELRNMLYQPNVQMILGSICTLNAEQLKLVLNFIQMLKNPALE